jgi:hypothetical protein
MCGTPRPYIYIIQENEPEVKAQIVKGMSRLISQVVSIFT